MQRRSRPGSASCRPGLAAIHRRAVDERFRPARPPKTSASCRAATRAAGPTACRSSSTRATPISATCSATAFPSSTCATRASPKTGRVRRRAEEHPLAPSADPRRHSARRQRPEHLGDAAICEPGRTITPSRWRIRCRPSSPSAPACACSTSRSRPARARSAFSHMPGFGAHRIWWVGGRYAYVSVHFEGFIDHTLAVVDVGDPTKPDARRTLVAARHAPRRRRDAARLVRQAHGAASHDHRRQRRLCRMARRRLHRSTT